MKTHRIALSAALLASTSLVSYSAAFAQEQDQVDDVIVVRYQYVPDDKRVTSEVSSFINADDIALTGDSDIASALGRVTGLSISDGRFVIVRGLDERYSNTLINGSPLASPEPFRRAVPLDLFPTNLISNILVQKTFSPQYPGEFGGGLVQIETSALPAERFFEVSVSASANTATSFDDGLKYAGGDYDWTGFSDDTRDWPSQYQNIFDSQNIGPNYQDPTTLAAIGRGLENSKLWIVQEGEVQPNTGFNFTAGDRFDFDGFSIGVLASIGYDNNWDTRKGQRATVSINNSGLDYITKYDRYSTENNIETNGMLNVGVEFGDHEIKALALVLRSTDKGAQIVEGINEGGNQSRNDSTSWYERQVYTYQLTGDHEFDALAGLEVDWRVSFSDASRNAPNVRSATYIDESSNPNVIDYQLAGQRSGNDINFSRVDETTNEWGVDFTLPTTLFDRSVEFKAGYQDISRERTAYSRTFFFDGSIPADLRSSRIDYIYADQNILDTRFRLTEVGGVLSPEAYKGTMDVKSVYLGSDFEVTPFLRAAVGFRHEDGEQTLDTFGFPREATDPGIIETTIDKDYILPAVTLTWTFADNLQARFGYSQSITRPQFREIGFTEFVNTDTDESFIGNPFLINTKIKNFDARVEWYFGRDQFLTGGVFYKQLDNPIVEFLLPSGESLSTSFINAPEATLLGLELEYEKTFDLSNRFSGDFWQNAELFLKTNYTYTKSDMKVSDGDQVTLALGAGSTAQRRVFDAKGFIEDGQRLQGQSEHIANIQVGWEDTQTGTRTALLWTYNSERTRALQNLSVGSGLPEVVETPPVQLDLVHSRQLQFDGAEYGVRFAVRNLLGENYEATQSSGGDTIVVDSYDIGTTFSISLSRTF
ncbi:TonB-dependent receptor domain-containing protein [Woodsholea maritima]|uniref:TonB-dependent receptor domain-containing protein n=1 Tax=Woodsholea maritima TaxID=240237 RepID=UPI000378DB55|nr:TonB-dependent receptor [Woodsholea maritima]